MPLLDLPPEIIDLLVSQLKGSEANEPRIDYCREFPYYCSCFDHGDLKKQLILYDRLDAQYETDLVRLGKVHPYISRCFLQNGYVAVVDALATGSGMIPLVPEEFRAMVEIVNVTSSNWTSQDAARKLGGPEGQTLQRYLGQFPSARRLDIDCNDDAVDDIESLHRNGEQKNVVEAACTITELIIRIDTQLPDDTGDITRLADVLQLPRLKQLQVIMGFEIEYEPEETDVDVWSGMFDQLQCAAVAWGSSLETVKVCVRVLLDGEPDNLDIWNLWEGALERLFRSFRSIPSCKVELCIVYLVKHDSPLPSDAAFHRKPDGSWTLRQLLAPVGEQNVQDFLERIRRTQDCLIPSFGLCIKHAKEGDTPEELVKIAYRRAPADHGSVSPSQEELVPTTANLVCHFDLERIAALHEAACTWGDIP